MVDRLIIEEWSAKMLGHDQTVLLDASVYVGVWMTWYVPHAITVAYPPLPVATVFAWCTITNRAQFLPALLLFVMSPTKTESAYLSVTTRKGTNRH